MITDIPSSDEFKKVAIECLIQAFNSIENVDNSLTNDTPREDVWNYNQIVLRTSIVLIHQGLEGLLKAEICKFSPLLLLDNKRSEWKTLPESKDEPFSDLFTIGAEDLLRTFYGCVGSRNVHENFLNLFKEIRIKRNKIVHGIGAEKLTPEYVLILILNSFTYTLGKNSFWDAISSKFYQHPGFQFEDEYLEWQDSIFYNRMEYLNAFLGIKELKKHFSINIASRAYLCPFCTEKAEQITTKGLIRPDAKWAFLNPNSPSSNKMSCIICSTDFGVIRHDCSKKKCKGNVLYLIDDDEDSETWICLTCWKEKKVISPKSYQID
jgi:hypothetical protein